MQETQNRRIRVGGVPEHFNEPWQLGIADGYFREAGIDLEWVSIKEGTGAMINLLKTNQLDVIVALTEGLINEIASNLGSSPVRLLGTYVQSSLLWSISTAMNSSFQTIEDLKGETFGISRYNSGSHLMSCVLANQYGWKDEDQIKFRVKDNFLNLRESVKSGETQAFMWESFMQKPFYDRGELRRLGELLTPWPCFLIASSEEFISSNLSLLETMFVVLRRSCQSFRENSSRSIERIVSQFHLTLDDAERWFNQVDILAKSSIEKSTIERTIDALVSASILPARSDPIDPSMFIDRRLCRLPIDIKSMRLYNKPELLIALRNNLRVAGLNKGSISYEDLLPFDQNHYFGTEVLDVAMSQLQFSPDDEANASSWFIQIGSNLAGCSRFLSGKYRVKILAIELQNDLSQAASELTSRCDLQKSIHHLAGNFLDVSLHLQENFYSAIVSWLTILHFNREERRELFQRSTRLLKPKGFFYLEDFIRRQSLEQEDQQILENEVFCQYLPTQEEYLQQLIDAGLKIEHVEDLSLQWKQFTQQRANNFQNNRIQLIKIHGEDLYQRLNSFYTDIQQLFQRQRVGGIRIRASK